MASRGKQQQAKRAIRITTLKQADTQFPILFSLVLSFVVPGHEVGGFRA
jgi:hypothetical protein